MELTKEFLQKKFNQYNKRFFNNELPQIKLEISRARKTFGCYWFRRNPNGTEIPLKITVSNYYIQTNKQYSEVLIHEMIHYYLSIKNIGRNENCHGYSFQKIMNEINSKSNFDVSVYGSSIGKQSKAYTAGKEHNIVFFIFNNIEYFSKVANSVTIEKLKTRFPDCKFKSIIKTKSQEAEKLISRTSKLSLIRATDENLKKYKIAA